MLRLSQHTKISVQGWKTEMCAGALQTQRTEPIWAGVNPVRFTIEVKAVNFKDSIVTNQVKSRVDAPKLQNSLAKGGRGAGKDRAHGQLRFITEPSRRSRKRSLERQEPRGARGCRVSGTI